MSKRERKYVRLHVKNFYNFFLKLKGMPTNILTPVVFWGVMHKSCGKEKEMFRDTEKETYFLPQLVFITKFTDWGKVHNSKGKKKSMNSFSQGKNLIPHFYNWLQIPSQMLGLMEFKSILSCKDQNNACPFHLVMRNWNIWSVYTLASTL